MKVEVVIPSGLTGDKAFDEASIEAASRVEGSPFIKETDFGECKYLVRTAWMVGYITAKLGKWPKKVA